MEIGATKAVQDRLKTTKIEESKGASLGQLFSEFINRQDQNGQLQKYLECPEILSGVF